MPETKDWSELAERVGRLEKQNRRLKYAGAVGLVLAAVLLLTWPWNQARPRPPEPWDTRAITAGFHNFAFDQFGSLVFMYTLANNTNFDYSITSESQVQMTRKMADGQTLIPWPGFKPEIPFYLPARQKMLFLIHSSLSLPLKKPAQGETAHVTIEEWKEYLRSLGYGGL